MTACRTARDRFIIWRTPANINISALRAMVAEACGAEAGKVKLTVNSSGNAVISFELTDKGDDNEK